MLEERGSSHKSKTKDRTVSCGIKKTKRSQIYRSMYRSRGRYISNEVHLNVSSALLPRSNGQNSTSSSSDLSIPRLVPLDPEQFDDSEDDCNSRLFPVSVEDILSESINNSQLEELNENVESLKENFNKIKATNLLANDNLELNMLSFEDSSKEDISNPLVQFKNKLRIFETTRRESFITSVTNFLNHIETTPALISLGIGFMIQKCLEKPFWSEILASHCSIFIRHKQFGRKAKEHLFNLLQKLYEERKCLQEQYPKKFSNSVVLLGQIFLRFRGPLNKHFKVFSEPLCEVLHMLCKSSSEEDVKVVAQQISLNGPALKQYSYKRYEELLLEVRLKLLETTDDNMRLWLLLTLDIAFYEQSLPAIVAEMYKNTLGLTVFNELKPPSISELSYSIPLDLVQYYDEKEESVYKK